MKKALVLLSGSVLALGATGALADYDLDEGQQVYEQTCAACHDAGVAGAPVTGEIRDWDDRLEKGMATLVENSIEGFVGDDGMMPPRGGNPDLSDEEVENSVAYMVDQVVDLDEMED